MSNSAEESESRGARSAEDRPVESRPGGPGPALRDAREERQITIYEVAEVLNLPSEIVEAIEANQFDALPSAVFAKGYIRAYAKLLELDSDPLVAAYPEAPEDTADNEALVRDQVGEFVRAHPQWVLGGAGGLVVLLLAILVIAIWPDAEPADAPATAVVPQPPSAQPSAQPAPQPAGAPEVSAQRQALPVVATEPAPSAEPDLAGDGDRGVESVTVVTPAPAQEAATRRITPDGDDRLQFQFSEECWVEVKSGSGANLYSNLGRSGQTLELVGRAPFRILLGYAPGVLMAFNGEPVALAPHTRNNVANLVLGQ